MTKVEEELNTLDDGYSAKDMAVLEGLEPVRKRPGMYIGSTAPPDCTTWCGRSWTTQSMRPWPGTAPRSMWHCWRTAVAASLITDAAYPST